MAGSKTTKRVAADQGGGGTGGAAGAAKGSSMLMRAKDGSGFIRCEECKKDVPVVLIDMHSCSLDSKIRMHLELHVVEQVQEKKKPAVPKKRKSPSSESKEGKGRKRSKNTDGTKRKRPPTAFFLFMADFRKEYAAAHPDSKSVAEVAKEGGVKWKAMSGEEKQQYIDKAAELKAEFDKASTNGDEVVEVEDGSDKEAAEADGIEEAEGEAEEKEDEE